MKFIGDLQCVSCHKSLRDTGCPVSSQNGDFVQCGYCFSVYSVSYDYDPETSIPIAYLTPVKVRHDSMNDFVSQNLGSFSHLSSPEADKLKEKIKNCKSVAEFLDSIQDK